MSMRHWIESSLAGAGIGAVVMYLFDPELGEKRRVSARHAAGDTLSSTGERVSEGWHSLADKAQDVAHDIAHAAGKWTSRAGRAVSDAGSTASDYAGQAADRAGAYGHSLSKSARDYAGSARGWFSHEPEHSHVSATEIIVGSLGALALGAGLMYMLDPAQGRRRRALVRDKAMRAMNQTSRYVERKGHHLSNKAQGVVAQAKSLAGEVKQKMTGDSTYAPGAT